MTVQAPQTSVDLFSEAALLDPNPIYRELREAGGAVWSSALELYVLARYEPVREALRDWESFSSAEGVSLDEHANRAAAGTVIASDDPIHAEKRQVVARPLAPGSIKALQEQITTEAVAVVDRLVARGQFDAVRELAWHLPLTIVSKFVGLPEEGRERMLYWTEAVGQLGGPNHPGAEESYKARKLKGLSVLGEVIEFLTTKAARDNLTPGSWGAMLYEAADRGEITHQAAQAMMMDYIGPALDTTINSISSMIWLFTQNPEQWRRVRADRALVAGAVIEAVRLEPPLHWFSRVLTVDYAIDGVTIPKGSRVLLLYAAANRDERKYADPDRFDPGRKASDHLGWGTGLHTCVGMHLARMEMQAILNALLDRVERIELDGPPERLLNASLHGFHRLPVRVN